MYQISYSAYPWKILDHHFQLEFMQILMSWAISDNQFILFTPDGSGEMLLDLTIDPLEANNLHLGNGNKYVIAAVATLEAKIAVLSNN